MLNLRQVLQELQSIKANIQSLFRKTDGIQEKIDNLEQRFTSHCIENVISDTLVIDDDTKTSKERKRALCIGINYTGTPYRLNGCINDAYSYAAVLKTVYGYNQIDVMTDITSVVANKNNILNSIRDLILDTKSTVKTITFSGHGSYILDRNGDETDKRDETWVSSDLQLITDDELFSLLSMVNPNVRMYIVSDSCHSGTMADLPFSCLLSSADVIVNNRQTLPCKNIVMLSGCRDPEYSYDAFIDKKFCGAMTWSLLSSLGQVREGTPREMLERITSRLKLRGFPQTPQWSSSSNTNQKIRFFS